MKESVGNISSVDQSFNDGFKVEVFSQQSTKYGWEIDDVMLGSGSIGQVYRARDQKSGKYYALKFVRYKNENDGFFRGLVQEAVLFRTIQRKSHANFNN